MAFLCQHLEEWILQRGFIWIWGCLQYHFGKLLRTKIQSNQFSLSICVQTQMGMLPKQDFVCESLC